MEFNKNEKHVLEIFEKLRLAMLANDTEPLEKHVADDYFGCDAGGRVHDREQMISAYGPGGVHLEKFTAFDIAVRSWENTVIISGNTEIRGSWEEHKFEHHSRFMDVYGCRESEWKLTASQITDHVKK